MLENYFICNEIILVGVYLCLYQIKDIYGIDEVYRLINEINKENIKPALFILLMIIGILLLGLPMLLYEVIKSKDNI